MKVIIVGGGLSGLTLAYKLSKQHIDATVLEAAPRLGGRIQTLKGKLDTPLELGATWFSDMHQQLIALVDELGLNKYEQFSRGKSLFQTKSFEPPQEFSVPESQSPSYRIADGTQLLIDTLANQLDKENIEFNTKVKTITDLGNELEIETSNGKKLRADKVILCLPPQLVGSQIQLLPELRNSVSIVLQTVQTWMAGSIKFVLEYDNPFWRNNGYSGMLFSHSGIVSEMHDHTNFEKNKFGFTGFLNGGAISYSQEVRKEFVLRQLTELLGNEVLNYSSYSDKVWTDEFVMSENQVVLRPHQNNGHSLLQNSYMNNKLFFSGTETAREFAGYMEGAIISALRVCQQIKSSQNKK
jgi:monoamine oxidase